MDGNGYFQPFPISKDLVKILQLSPPTIEINGWLALGFQATPMGVTFRCAIDPLPFEGGIPS